MDDNYHIFSNGKLKREEDSLVFRSEDSLEHIPVNNVESIFCHSQITYNTRCLDFLDTHNIALHIFNWSGQKVGTFLPTQDPKSGKLIVKQVKSVENLEDRKRIGAEIIRSSIHNMRRNVKYYNENGELDSIISSLNTEMENATNEKQREDIMGVEASARESYYKIFSTVTTDEFEFNQRTYNPPQNEINAMMSYGNSILYSTVTSAIQKTGLNPAISYVHVSGNRRDSLSLDLADIFKPVLVDRLLLRLINRSQITRNDFRSEVNKCLLTESGRKTYLKEFEELMDETIEHKDLNRKVTYQYLLRLEAHKLKKDILANETYSGFRRWW